MRLYNLGLSPNAMRVRAVAFELGVELEIVDIDLRGGGNRTPEFLALNPNGKVPVLVDGDFVLWESRAINAYLAALRPEAGLYPTDLKARAVIDQWSYWHAVHLSPAMQRVTFERALKQRFGMGEPDETKITGELKETTQLLGVLDGNLAGKQWVAGDLSIADFAVATTFAYRDAAGIDLGDFPGVAAWIARIEARPSWQKAVAPALAFVKG